MRRLKISDNMLKSVRKGSLSGVLLIMIFSTVAAGTGYSGGKPRSAGEQGRPTGSWSPTLHYYISYLLEASDDFTRQGIIGRVGDEEMKIICRLRGVVEEQVDDGELLKLPSPEMPFAASYRPGPLAVIADRVIPCTKRVEVSALVLEPLQEMVAFVNSHPGCRLVVASGYRPYERQAVLFANRTNRVLNEHPELEGDREKAQAVAGRIVAVPGTSQHMTGRAVDFTTAGLGGCLEIEFADTFEGILLKEHAWRYGFVFPYAEGKEEITGYIYEPWHLLYVGKYHAEMISKNDWVIEEYRNYMQKEKSVLFKTLEGKLRRYLYNEKTGTTEVYWVKEKEPSPVFSPVLTEIMKKERPEKPGDIKSMD